MRVHNGEYIVEVLDHIELVFQVMYTMKRNTFLEFAYNSSGLFIGWNDVA